MSLELHADPLRVVISSRDALVVEFQCMNAKERLAMNAVTVRRIVRQSGYVSYHVEGGVPPYSVFETGSTLDGQMCVTVIDAMGDMASGCGVYATRVDIETVSCPGSQEEICEPGNGLCVDRSSGMRRAEARWRGHSSPRSIDKSLTRSKPGPDRGGTAPPLHRGTSSKGPDRPTGDIVSTPHYGK